MAQNNSEKTEIKAHHFLFHVFKMDRAENPMPRNQAERLIQYLKRVFVENKKNVEERN